MTGKLKRLITPVLILIGLAVPLAVPAIVSADIQSSLCGAATTQKVDVSADCQKATKGSESRFQGILNDIINIFSIIVGIVAVIMIIFGGFKYITSAGNQESVKSARQTLIYAIIGLVIVALAQVIVRFVLHETTSTPSSGGGAGTGSSTKPPQGRGIPGEN